MILKGRLCRNSVPRSALKDKNSLFCQLIVYPETVPKDFIRSNSKETDRSGFTKREPHHLHLRRFDDQHFPVLQALYGWFLILIASGSIATAIGRVINDVIKMMLTFLDLKGQKKLGESIML